MKSIAALVIIAVFAAMLCSANPCEAKVFGDVTLAAGGTWPQGSFASYGDPGPHGLLRVSVQVPEVRALMGWFDANFTHFSSQTSPAEIEVRGRTFPVDERISQDAFSMHLGLQVGNHTRSGFFRPRAGMGFGLYFFYSTYTLKEVRVGGGDEEDFFSEVDDSQELLGWRGQIGADFFFVPRWGISFDLLYDHVWNLNRQEGETSAKQTSRYNGFAIGIVVPFETFRR
jgi:hypothetical protein